MVSRQGIRLIAFVLVLALGVTAGVARRQAQRSGREDFLSAYSRLLTYPFISGTQAVVSRMDHFTGIFRTNARLKRENARLRSDLTASRQRANTAGELFSETKRLQSLLALQKAEPLRTVAARVLVRPSTPVSESCRIGAGRDRGVSPGAAVLSAGGLVGVVVEPGSSSSQVLLLRDRRSAVAAFAQRTRSPGVVKGQGSFLTMEYIPAGADVKHGDAVVSSGEGGVYPSGLLIGQVQSVEKSEEQHFVRAFIRPAVEFRAVEEVLVVVDQ